MSWESELYAQYDLVLNERDALQARIDELEARLEVRVFGAIRAYIRRRMGR